MTEAKLFAMGQSLGSDVPFFLQSQPALATGRGERVQALDFFPAFRGIFVILIHPGFGVSTAWAYQKLAEFPEARESRPGRADELICDLEAGDLKGASAKFYNSLEAPVLFKYPLLALFQEFLRGQGALAALMSGSGSTTFALIGGKSGAETLVEKFSERFSKNCWTKIVELESCQ